MVIQVTIFLNLVTYKMLSSLLILSMCRHVSHLSLAYLRISCCLVVGQRNAMSKNMIPGQG